MNPNYLPFAERTPDKQYQNALKMILRNGVSTKNPYQTTGRKTLLTLPALNFKLSNGAPIITERKVGFWRKPIGELLGFIHGVRDARVLAEKWGVNWWAEKWATPEKCAEFNLEPYDMGPGSYGGALEYIGPDGSVFNQYRELLRQVKDNPYATTHKVTTWLPHYVLGNRERVRKVVVAPCHGDVEVVIIGKRLWLRMDQRSPDFPIGVPANMIQYTALAIGIAHVTGFEPYMLQYVPHQSHFYVDQKKHVIEMKGREPRRLPGLYLNEEGLKVENLFDFRPSHFELRDYDPHPAIPDIPTTI